MKKMFAAIVAIVMIIGFAAYGYAEVVQDAIPALELYEEFKQDVEGVSDQYMGERIVVTGVIVRTGPDIHGTPSIELSSEEGGKAYVLFVVNSYSQLDEVSVGETVTMSGNFHIFGSDDWVVLKQGEMLSMDTGIEGDAV